MLFEFLYGRHERYRAERRRIIERHRLAWEQRLDRLAAYLKGMTR
jgi:hypothetical protein